MCLFVYGRAVQVLLTVHYVGPHYVSYLGMRL